MKMIFFSLLVSLSLYGWESGRVVTVIDGDTVMLQEANGTVVKARLVALDTFETKVNHRAFIQLETLKRIHPRRKHSLKEVLHWGYEAKRYATAKVLHQPVEYHRYGRDRYGRLLIYIKNLNYLLIRTGLAVEYPTNLLHPRLKEFLLEASREANLEKRGIYSHAP